MAAWRGHPPQAGSWHIDLIHYVHKGGSDGSLSNHRPLALVEVFRKVITSVIRDRMKRDLSVLDVLDSTDPGFSGGANDCQLDLSDALGG